MIEYSNEVFTKVAEAVRAARSETRVVGEYVQLPASFPCVTVDETSNVPVHLDSAGEHKYAEVRYRIQVFANDEVGKRASARALMAVADEAMEAMGFQRLSWSTTPMIYNAAIYQITTVYRGVIREDGLVYRR